jgi:type I restriction enzyme S subunit
MSTATTHIDNKPSLQASHCEDKGRSKRKQSHTLAPALRFNEFDGDWNESRLNDVAEFKKGKGISKADISEDGVLECIRYGELYTTYTELIQNIVSKTNLSAKDLILSEFNDVIIPASGESNIDIATASCVLKSGVAYSGDLNIIRSKMDGIFLSFYLNNKRKFDIARLAQGVSVVHLYSSQLKTLKLNLPSLPEQQKIASFLSAVDEKIQQLTKKKALLADYKKGVMQQLFSGQLRFKDENGKDYPDWEEKRLGEVFGVIRGKGISKDQLNDNGETKCILYGQLYTTYNEVVFNVVSRTDTNEGVLSIKGDLLVPSSTTTTGIDLANVTALNEEGVLLGGDISILRSKLDANNVFYAYYLSNHKKYEIAAFAQGSTIVHLSYNHFKVMRIDIPVIEEQQKIATYLSGIDTKIESVNNQITQTQTFKKGLLQQMFV